MELDFNKPIRIEALNLEGDAILDTSLKFKNIDEVNKLLKSALYTDGSVHIFLYQSGKRITDFIMNY